MGTPPSTRPAAQGDATPARAAVPPRPAGTCRAGPLRGPPLLRQPHGAVVVVVVAGAVASAAREAVGSAGGERGASSPAAPAEYSHPRRPFSLRLRARADGRVALLGPHPTCALTAAPPVASLSSIPRCVPLHSHCALSPPITVPSPVSPPTPSPITPRVPSIPGGRCPFTVRAEAGPPP